MAKKQTKKTAPARPQLGDNVEIPGAGVVVRSPITETLEQIPQVLPALMRCEKVQHRAGRAGDGPAA